MSALSETSEARSAESTTSLVARLHALLDVLEVREAQLDTVVSAGGASQEVVAELARVQAEVLFYLQALDDMGAFSPPDDAERATGTSCS